MEPRQPPVIKARESSAVHRLGVRDRALEIQALGSLHLPHQAFGSLDHHGISCRARRGTGLELLDGGRGKQRSDAASCANRSRVGTVSTVGSGRLTDFGKPLSRA